MAPLKIYGLAASTCTGRVMATAFEKGVPFEIETVDLSKGAQKQPQYLAMQPFGVIPVLQDGDLQLFESRAIARYIATKYEEHGTALYGKSLEEKALVEQWLEVESQNYNPPISTIVGQILFRPKYGLPTQEEVVKENMQKLEKVLDIYEAHLGKSEYLAGNFFSLADLSHIPYAHYLIHMTKKGDLITSRPHVNAWWERISSRPSWKKVCEMASNK